MDRKEYLCDLSDKDNKNCVSFDERTDFDKNKHLLHLPHPDGNIYTCSTLYSYQNGKCVYNDIFQKNKLEKYSRCDSNNSNVQIKLDNKCLNYNDGELTLQDCKESEDTGETEELEQQKFTILRDQEHIKIKIRNQDKCLAFNEYNELVADHCKNNWTFGDNMKTNLIQTEEESQTQKILNMNNDKELCIQTDGNKLKLGSCTENGLLSNNEIHPPPPSAKKPNLSDWWKNKLQEKDIIKKFDNNSIDVELLDYKRNSDGVKEWNYNGMPLCVATGNHLDQCNTNRYVCAGKNEDDVEFESEDKDFATYGEAEQVVDKIIESVNSINKNRKWPESCPRSFHKGFKVVEKSELKC